MHAVHVRPCLYSPNHPIDEGTDSAMSTPHASRHTSHHRARRTAIRTPGDIWLLAFTVILMAVAVASSRMPDAEPAVTTTHIVESGDSLWALASAHPMAGLDTAQTVDMIARINSLESARLTVGAELLLPGKGSPDVAVAMRE